LLLADSSLAFGFVHLKRGLHVGGWLEVDLLEDVSLAYSTVLVLRLSRVLFEKHIEGCLQVITSRSCGSFGTTLGL